MFSGVEVALNSTIYEEIEGRDVLITIEILNTISLAREFTVMATIESENGGWVKYPVWTC